MTRYIADLEWHAVVFKVGSGGAPSPLSTDQHSSSVFQAGKYNRLQSFLRLQQKVRQSLENLNDAIVMHANKRTAGINLIVINILVVIKKILFMLNVPIRDLLLFQGNINTAQVKPLYARLFFQPRVTRKGPVFTTDENGKYLSSSSLIILGHRRTILFTLLLNNEELNSIPNGAQWMGNAITLQSILQDQSVLSNALGLPGLIPETPLNPGYARTVLEKFKQLKKVGWT